MRPLRALLFAAALLLMGTAVQAQTVNITSNIAADQTWGPTGTVIGQTFWVKNSIAINAGVTLRVQAGTVVKFSPGCQLLVYGALRAIGSAADTVVFTSYKDDNNRGGDTNGDGNATQPAVADWNSIVFPTSSSAFASRLHICDIRYAGSSSYGALTFQSVSDSISNCVIRRSTYGIDCQGSAAPVLSNTSIEASTFTPIVLDFTATPVLSSLVFSSSNNGYDAFGLRGGTLTGTATLPKRGATVGVNPIANVTYVLLGSLTINPGASLTVNPGVVIKPTGGGSIGVYGNLTMNGTAAPGDTITITSINDDNFGSPNDTNNNGSITAPQRGDWGYINFVAGSTGSISYCRLKFGSTGGANGMVNMTGVAIPVNNSLLSDAAHGIGIFGAITPTIANVQINNCNSTPILMSVAANPTFTNVNFLANSITALGLQSESVSNDSRIAVRSISGYSNITYCILNGGITMVSPAKLTIDPGIVIKNQLNSGGFQIDGALVANGKPDSLIVFTSLYDDQYGLPADTNGDGSTTTPGQGNWTYIHFTATSNDALSKLNWCRITYGSYGPFDAGPNSLWCTSAAPTIRNCFIFKSAYGMRFDGDAAANVDSTTFDNLQYAPIIMSVLSDPQIGLHNTYSTNGYNALALLNETLSQNATIKYRPGVGNAASPTFCYLPVGVITVPAGVSLSIQPQVVIKPSGAFTLFDVSGSLNIVGSNNTTNRVFFTSRRDDALGGDTTPTDASSPQAGDWGQINFNDPATDAACIIRNVKLQFGSTDYNYGVFTMTSAGPRFANLEFFQCGCSFTFKGNSTPTLDSLTILNSTTVPINSSLVSSPTYGTNITFANCRYLGLGIYGETIAQNVRTRIGRIGSYANLNYIACGTVGIAFGAKWTIDPGVVLKFGRIYYENFGSSINVDGAISARGKTDSLIVFTSLADDQFGQDVASDGVASVPANSNWSGINFSAISNDTANVFTYCRFRYGGFGNSGHLGIVSAAPNFTNCQFTVSGGCHAYITGNSTPVFTSCDFDSTAAEPPVYLSLVSDPVFSNCRFQGNKLTALGVVPEAIAQDVLWKIRPVANRNNMPFYLNGQLTVGLGATLTMQPGVIVKLGPSGSVFVQRAMVAQGGAAPESLIVFTSIYDDFYGGDSNNDGILQPPYNGAWGYVTIDGTAIDANVKFKDCVFRYGGGGSSYGALRCVNSSPSVDSCLFAYNTVGISAEGASQPTIQHSSLYGNQYYAVNNSGNAFCVPADHNWWGAASGPNDANSTADLCGLGSNAGTGDVVSNNVNYSNFLTTGIQNPLLGDVSLNGQVLAYDASLVLQYTSALLVLQPLQLVVGDVSGNGGVTALDASYILQWVAGVIPAFPGNSNAAHRAPAGDDRGQVLAAGHYGLTLGTAVRAGTEWQVPVELTADTPAYAFELSMTGGDAATFTSATPSDGGVLHADGVTNGRAATSMAAITPLTAGTVAILHFAAGDGDFHAPQVAFARVNETVVTAQSPIVPSGPSVSFLGRPSPNPAKVGSHMDLAIAPAQSGVRASVKVLDIAGRTLRTLVDGPLPAGTKSVDWDLSDDGGHRVPAGLYFVRAQAGAFQATHRLIVVR